MEKIFKRQTFYLFVIAMGMLAVSCSKNPTYTINTTDMDMVYTEYVEGTNFADYKSYFIPDSMVFDDESELTADEKAMFQRTYENVSAQLVVNMNKRNYVQTMTEEGSDIAISISIITRTNYVFGYGGWWGYPGWGYPGWGYPGYGYYYPWYQYLGSYEDGAVITDMVDLKNVEPGNEKIIMPWSCLIGGLLSNSASSNTERLTKYVDVAFDQSPYILTNP
ncbi:MAG: DUF4136 domain-containing protein [Bacteroidota bacterium]|nr:DUF4136 domain-containing protein [Bacteroidota bacterium]